MTQRLWSAPGEGTDLVIRGARVVDPQTGIDDQRDVLVADGRIAKVARKVAAAKGVRVVDGSERIVLPGFVDLHAHFRVPGREDEEDLGTASAAAAAGGYVAAFGMANTDPVVDTASVLRSLGERAATQAVVPLGFWASVTRDLAGEQLSEMWELADAGAVGFSDDGRPLPTALLARRALQYAKVSGRPVAVHGQDDSLTADGVMHEGAVSARLGLAGMPAIAESLDVARAVEIAVYEGARLHVCHVSTPQALDHIRRGRSAGAALTCEVTPHHLTLTDEALVSLDPNFKMNPPLRPESYRRALVEGLADGTIDCVATDHAPHARHEKEVPFEAAAFGTIGLETAFAVVHDVCVLGGDLPLATVAERMSQAPARIAGIEVPAIRTGELANLCLVDPQRTWTVDRTTLQSRSDNSAWSGRTLTGKVLFTVAAGRLAWEDLG